MLNIHFCSNWWFWLLIMYLLPFIYLLSWNEQCAFANCSFFLVFGVIYLIYIFFFSTGRLISFERCNKTPKQRMDSCNKKSFLLHGPGSGEVQDLGVCDGCFLCYFLFVFTQGRAKLSSLVSFFENTNFSGWDCSYCDIIWLEFLCYS